MQVVVQRQLPPQTDLVAVVIDKSVPVEHLASALPAEIQALAAHELSHPRADQTTDLLRLASTQSAVDVLLVYPDGSGPGAVREALFSAAAKGRLRGKVAVIVGAHLPAAAEGILLGAYRFNTAGPGTPDAPTHAVLVAPVLSEQSLADTRAEVERAAVLAEMTNWARRLVDTPPGEKTPTVLASTIVEAAAAVGVQTRVWSPETLAEHGFGGTLGVGRGSANEPRLVELTLRAGEGSPIVLIGKGVTFDAGGLSIKNDRTQSWMKADMGGAAAVAAAVVGAARRALPVNVTALLLLVENMPSGTAIRPGDVVHHPNGRTTEVTNTDAEGRLLLADALAYAATFNPAAVVDVATLTSALLGGDLWMLFSNEDGLANELLDAGDRAGEPGWRLPLLAAMTRHLDSTVADLKNYSFDHARVDTLAAAAYLSSFVDAFPWAHLDVVGTAFHASTDRWPAGATGSPTRALMNFLVERGERGGVQ